MTFLSKITFISNYIIKSVICQMFFFEHYKSAPKIHNVIVLVNDECNNPADFIYFESFFCISWQDPACNHQA